MQTHAPNFRAEARVLVRLGLPIVLTQLSMMLLGVVDLAMVGRVGVEAIAAVALGNIWKVGTLFVAMGVVLGIDPLVAQAHGAGDGRGTALALQRGLVVALAASVPVALAWLGTERGLIALGQEAEVARIAHEYVLVQLPSIPFFLAFSALRQYLQGRGILWPTLAVALAANVLNVAGNWVLIFGNLGAPALGAVGSGIATSAVQLALPVFAFAAIRAWRLHEGAWTPWSRAALELRALARIVATGVPVAAQFACEIWAFQIVALWAGRLGREELAANSIVLNLASVSFMLPLGIGLAAVTRVGNLIGARRFHDAQRSAYTAFALGVGAMSACALAFLAFRWVLPRFYGAGGEVLALCAAVLPIAAAFQVFDGIQVVGAGILRGMGRTRPAAVFNLLGYYALGLPLAYVLAFERGLELKGLWWGLAVGLAAVAVPIFIWVARAGPGRVERAERAEGE